MSKKQQKLIMAAAKKLAKAKAALAAGNGKPDQGPKAKSKAKPKKQPKNDNDPNKDKVLCDEGQYRTKSSLEDFKRVVGT